MCVCVCVSRDKILFCIPSACRVQSRKWVWDLCVRHAATSNGGVQAVQHYVTEADGIQVYVLCAVCVCVCDQVLFFIPSK